MHFVCWGHAATLLWRCENNLHDLPLSTMRGPGIDLMPSSGWQKMPLFMEAFLSAPKISSYGALYWQLELQAETVMTAGPWETGRPL